MLYLETIHPVAAANPAYIEVCYQNEFVVLVACFLEGCELNYDGLVSLGYQLICATSGFT